MILDSNDRPMQAIDGKPLECDHGVKFDEDHARRAHLTEHQVRAIYPRLFGPCPKGCGFSGIAYASAAHFVWGDW